MLALAVLGALLVPVGAEAQSDDTYTRWGGMRDRFHINAGAFFVGHDTFALLRPSGSEIPGVNIESDAGVPDSTGDFRLEGYLRLGKRHRLVAGYNYANIDVQLQVGDILQRDFEYRYKFRGPVVYAVLSF